MQRISPADRYYIINGYVGNNALFWRPNGGGYTCHLDDAGVYSLQEARTRTSRKEDQFWPAELVEASASLQVDMQRLRRVDVEEGEGLLDMCPVIRAQAHAKRKASPMRRGVAIR